MSLPDEYEFNSVMLSSLRPFLCCSSSLYNSDLSRNIMAHIRIFISFLAIAFGDLIGFNRLSNNINRHAGKKLQLKFQLSNNFLSDF